MSRAKVSVVIPVLNMAKGLGKCLEAVFAQSLKPHEVIVIDGGSTDGTLETAAVFKVKVLHEHNNSIAEGRQIGVDSASGDYIAFTDADCVPHKDWLANLLKEFQDGIIGVGGGINNIGENFWENSVNLATNTLIGGGTSIQGRLFHGRRTVQSISACNSMYRKRDIMRHGGFDRSLPGGEELELNKRLAKSGKFIYTSDAMVDHYHRWTLKKFARKMFRYGKERGMIRAWNIQIIPAIAVPLLILSAFFTRWPIIITSAAYFAAILAMGARIALREGNRRYRTSIPTVYIVGHFNYTIGTWCGLTKTRRQIQG